MRAWRRGRRRSAGRGGGGGGRGWPGRGPGARICPTKVLSSVFMALNTSSVSIELNKYSMPYSFNYSFNFIRVSQKRARCGCALSCPTKGLNEKTAGEQAPLELRVRLLRVARKRAGCAQLPADVVTGRPVTEAGSITPALARTGRSIARALAPTPHSLTQARTRSLGAHTGRAH